MKILISARNFVPPLVGGADVYADRLGKALQKAGHKVGIIAVDPTAVGQNEEITTSLEKYNGVSVWRLKFDFAQRPKEAFDYAYDPEMGLMVRELLKEQKPELFIILNFYMLTLAGVEAAKSLGIPVIHIATDFLPVCRRATFIRWNGRSCQVGESPKNCAECFVSNRFLGRVAASALNRFSEETLVSFTGDYHLPHPLWILKPYWKQLGIMEQRLSILRPLRKQIDLVLTPTQFTRDKFLENGFSDRQVHFLPFGVENDHLLAAVKHFPSPNRRFLFIGRLQPYKGAHLLIEAFKNLKSPNGAILKLYGTAADGYEEYFTRLNEMITSNERISFGGRLAPSELSSVFANADYFVLPSTWHENSPLIILDALQSKTPVISSDITGVTDLVKDGVNGLLFPMGNADALRQVMQRAIDRTDLLARLKSGVDLPSIEDYVEKMFRLWRAAK